jgi:hypothetical protein
MSRFLDVTAVATRDAFRLYFEPLIAFGRNLRAKEQPPVTPERLLVEEVRKSQAYRHLLRDLPNRDLSLLVSDQRVFVTCAGHPFVSTIIPWLLGSAAEIVLLDDYDRRSQVIQKWAEVFAAPSTKGISVAHSVKEVSFLFGDLADEKWLGDALAEHNPSVVIDFASLAYMNAPFPQSQNAEFMQGRAMQAWERSEVVLNVVRCSASTEHVRSILLMLPRMAGSTTIEHFSRLRSAVLEYTDAFGIYSPPDSLTVTVWSPKKSDGGIIREPRQLELPLAFAS